MIHAIMAQKKHVTKTDVELLRQLNAAAAEDTPVEAVFRLQHSRGSASTVGLPDKVEALVHDVIKRVERQSGSTVTDYNIFRNLGFFVVSAKPAFLKEMLAQPEIASATANRQPDEIMIRPKRKRVVS